MKVGDRVRVVNGIDDGDEGTVMGVRGDAHDVATVLFDDGSFSEMSADELVVVEEAST